MQALPVPKTRYGWLTAVVLILLTFLFYYLYGVNLLLAYYQEAFLPLPLKPSDEQQISLQITLLKPRYASLSIPTFMYGRITNNSNQSLCVSFIVVLEQQSQSGSKNPEQESKNNSNQETEFLLLPRYYTEGGIFSRRVNIESIAPYETVHWRLPMSVSSDIPRFYLGTMPADECDFSKIKVWKEVKPKNKDVSEEAGSIKEDRKNSLSMVLLESILLPPWSNGVIPVVVMLVCYFVEGWTGKEEKDKNFLEKEFWLIFLEMLVLALLLLLLLTIVVLGLLLNSKSLLWLLLVVFIGIAIWYIFVRKRSVIQTQV